MIGDDGETVRGSGKITGTPGPPGLSSVSCTVNGRGGSVAAYGDL